MTKNELHSLVKEVREQVLEKNQVVLMENLKRMNNTLADSNGNIKIGEGINTAFMLAVDNAVDASTISVFEVLMKLGIVQVSDDK